MLLFAESFDYYGDDETKMLDGLWAEVSSGFNLSTTRARTGTRSLKMSSDLFPFGQNQARRVFGGGKTSVGLAFASYLSALPNSNDTYGIMFRDTANSGQFTIFVQSTGILEVKRGNFAAGYTSLGTSVVPVVTANAWHHIEIKAVAGNGTAGAVEIRVNEVTRINLTGIDTIQTSNVEFSQFAIGDDSNSAANADWYIDDLFAWDTTVDGDNDIVDFVGDKKCFTMLPNADTAQADFAKSSGTVGYSLIDDPTPDDADYIYTDTDGDFSDFGLTDLPGEVTEIIGVVALPRVLKSDAGTVTHAADIVSGSSATAADAIPATTQATYWPFVHTKDPASGVPFTPSDLNAAKLRLTRA